MLFISILFFKQKTAYELGLGIPAEPLFRSLLRHGSDKTLQVGYANHFYRSAHKFEQICRHRLRRQNVGYSNFSQPQSHLSFCVLLQYLVERRRVVTQLGKDRKSGSAGMPRPISYAVFCLKKKKISVPISADHAGACPATV